MNDYPNDELALLTDLVTRPGATRQYAEQFLVEPDAFQNLTLRSLWCALLGMRDADSVALLDRVSRDLKFKGRDKDSFLDLESVVVSQVARRAHKMGMTLYQRRIREAMNIATQSIADCGDAESLAAKVNLAVAAVPKPPSLGTPREVELAEEMSRESTEEIPERLLHVPGFVDDVTEYSMASAFNPNRTLSFAGALALAAHLMGRKYTDMRGTRTNLFVFALGPSGIGKEWPRRVTREVLRACRLSPTVHDDFASGEALEEMLYRQPCTIVQLDEIQKLVQSLRDERNSMMLGKAKFLMSLYSSSGEDHAMRPKATDPESIGRVIADPSLTLFGTGIAKAVFQAMTVSLVEEGLLGRCLIFDTEHEADPNTFDDGRPQLPRSVIAAAQEISRACGEKGNSSLPFEPELVPYAKGVNARINEINAEIKRRKQACNKKGDRAGTALWARAPEKIGKLALIHAVSARRQNPEITLQGVEWAWEFVQVIVTRMLRRLTTYMTSGPITEACREIVEFLVATGGRSTRREAMRAAGVEGAKMMDEIEATLVDRGEITVVAVGRGSKIYRLAKASDK